MNTRVKLLLAVVVFLLSGCVSLPRAQSVPITNTQHTIYVIYRGWHTSILLDATSLAAQNPLLVKNLLGEKFARVGFGDGDYFTGKSKTFGSAAKALFVSSYSALQLLTYDYDPFDEIPAETRTPVAITNLGLHNLIDFINQSIELDTQGVPVRLPAAGDAMGYFFKANTRYGIFTNCNTWTAHALRVAGLPVATRLTASGVFQQAKTISGIQANAGLLSPSLK